MKNKFTRAIIILTFSLLLSGCANNPAENTTTADATITSEATTDSADTIQEVSGSDIQDAASVVATEESEETKPSETPSQPTESTQTSQESKPAEPETPAYTVEPMDKTMYAQNAVNLRKGPSTDYEKAGSLTKGQEVHVIGRASTGWYQLENELFVSNSYLGDSAPVITPEPVPQPEAQAPALENNNTNTGSSSNNSSESSPTFVLADDGYWKDGVFHPFNNGGSSSGSSSSEPVSQPETQAPVEEVYTYDIYLVSDLLTLVNNQRTANGVAAFTWNSSREEDAKVRARELVDSFTHSSPSGITSGGECITQNGPSAQTIYNAYSGSEMHFTSLTVMEINTTFVSANCAVYVNGEYRTTYNVILMD